MTRREADRIHWTRVAIFLGMAVLVGLLTGCGKPSSARALERYEMVMDVNSTVAERCEASGEVADAFLSEGNRESYRQWHAIHTIQCMADEPMVVE